MKTVTREIQWSELQRDPKGVAALADAGDVRVKRRDGADLVLTRADRAGTAGEGAVTAARAFRAMLAHSPADVIASAFADEFPWVLMLPPDDVTAFAADFVRGALAAAEVGQWDVLGQVIREWKATAAIHADPVLLAELAKPITDDHGPVRPPATGQG